MNIFKLEIRNLRKSVITSTLSISCIIFFMLAFYPSMKSESMQNLAFAKLDGIDPSLLAALGLSVMPDFSVISVFFGYVLQFLVLVMMFIIASQAVNLLHKEEKEGTIEFLAAKPVSRIEIMSQKLLAHIVLLVCMLIVFAIVTVIGYSLFSDLSLKDAISESLTFYSAILFVGMIYTSIAFMISAFLKSTFNTSSITISIVLGTYILGVLSIVVKKLDFLYYFSPMDWIKAEKLLSKGILIDEWVIGISVIIITLFLSLLKYRKKDLLI